MRTDAIEEVTAMRRDVNDTLVFVRVVQEGSFTAAAHALQIPKTTISRRVLELEKHVGAQLLRRTTRKLSVTEAGAIYYEHCRGIAATLEHAEGEVHKLRDGPRGWLRLTMPYSFGVDWIAPLLPGFRTRYPDVKIEIVASHATLDLVESEIDIALRLGELPDSSLVARRLASFPSGAFASPAYVKRAGLPPSPEQLCDHRTLTLHQARRDVGYVWPMRKGTGKPRGFIVHPRHRRERSIFPASRAAAGRRNFPGDGDEHGARREGAPAGARASRVVGTAAGAERPVVTRAFAVAEGAGVHCLPEGATALPFGRLTRGRLRLIHHCGRVSGRTFAVTNVGSSS